MFSPTIIGFWVTCRWFPTTCAQHSSRALLEVAMWWGLPTPHCMRGHTRADKRAHLLFGQKGGSLPWKCKREFLQNQGVDPKKFGTTSHSWRGIPLKEGIALHRLQRPPHLPAFAIWVECSNRDSSPPSSLRLSCNKYFVKQIEGLHTRRCKLKWLKVAHQWKFVPFY